MSRRPRLPARRRSLNGLSGTRWSLTASLNIALTALREWGERHVVDGPPRVLRRRSDGKPVVAALVPKGTKTLKPDEVELVPPARR